MMRRLGIVFSFVLLAYCCSAQSTSSTSTPSDPQAVTLLNEAQAALSGTNALSDTTLNGSATWTAGSTKASGSIQLLAKSTTEALTSISAGSYSRSELRNDTDEPAGQITLADGTKTAMPLHNCFVPAAWFSPALIVLGLNSQDVTLRYIGSDTRDGIAVHHLRASRTIAGQPAKIANEIQALSTVDLYLDANTHVPVMLSFSTHPDDDFLINFPVDIHFGKYTPVDGTNVPFHIRRMLQGTLQLDVTLSSAAVNTGIPDSTFAIQ